MLTRRSRPSSPHVIDYADPALDDPCTDNLRITVQIRSEGRFNFNKRVHHVFINFSRVNQHIDNGFRFVGIVDFPDRPDEIRDAVLREQVRLFYNNYGMYLSRSKVRFRPGR